MKKIITIAMVICMLLTTIVLSAPVTFSDVSEEYESTPISSSIQDINTKIDDIGLVGVGIIRSPMISIIALIIVILALLVPVLFLVTFIYAIRWVINNKKDKESEKTKKLSKKAIGFAIATVVSFILYIVFLVIIIPLTKVSLMF